MSDVPYCVHILWKADSQVDASADKTGLDTPNIRRKISSNGFIILSKQPMASFSMYANVCFLYLCVSKVITLFRTALWHVLDGWEPCCISGRIPLSSSLCISGRPMSILLR